jgi:Domain of unknown function (DUF1906)
MASLAGGMALAIGGIMNRTSTASSLLRALAGLSLLTAASSLTAGCGGGEGGGDADGIGVRGEGLDTTYGVDYSWARPSPAGLAAQGFTFAARYLSYDTSGKNLSAGEASALNAAGLDVVSNWEAGSEDALGGYATGVEEAKAAESQALADGMPAGRPIYFSVDFDATPAQQAALDDYMDGVASVIGRERTGAYGGYYVIERLFDQGKIAWGWQTYAWSGGQWDSRAQLRQIQNGIDGGQLDKDEALVADFGQWTSNGGKASPPAAPPPAAPPASPPTSNCDVHSDGKLYCVNSADAAMYASSNFGSGVVNHLETTSSWFTCWGKGELHPGGNTTWYYTLGDANGNWGWVPAVDLQTTDSFDADPTAHGLKACAATLPPLPANCDVHSDAKLHCVNDADSAMYKSSNFGSGVVNHLETTNSWFECWGTGELHSGGNTTWYYTLGDANGNWGWVPAVDLSTPSSFDANPSAYGLAHCN